MPQVLAAELPLERIDALKEWRFTTFEGWQHGADADLFAKSELSEFRQGFTNMNVFVDTELCGRQSEDVYYRAESDYRAHRRWPFWWIGSSFECVQVSRRDGFSIERQALANALPIEVAHGFYDAEWQSQRSPGAGRPARISNGSSWRGSRNGLDRQTNNGRRLSYPRSSPYLFAPHRHQDIGNARWRWNRVTWKVWTIARLMNQLSRGYHARHSLSCRWWMRFNIPERTVAAHRLGLNLRERPSRIATRSPLCEVWSDRCKPRLPGSLALMPFVVSWGWADDLTAGLMPQIFIRYCSCFFNFTVTFRNNSLRLITGLEKACLRFLLPALLQQWCLNSFVPSKSCCTNELNKISAVRDNCRPQCTCVFVVSAPPWYTLTKGRIRGIERFFYDESHYWFWCSFPNRLYHYLIQHP